MEWHARDFVAIYAAVVSTAVLIWQIVTWLRPGPRLRGRASANMVGYDASGHSDGQRFVMFNVENVGTGATTITHVALYGYAGWRAWLRKRHTWAAIIDRGVAAHPLPYVLNAGHTFTPLANQTDELERWSRDMWLYGAIVHSSARHPLLMRIAPIPAQPGDD